MKVLMFGWEFPPHISGGLGTACYGLTRSLTRENLDILFVVPKVHGDEPAGNMQLISASHITMPAPETPGAPEATAKVKDKGMVTLRVSSALSPYHTPQGDWGNELTRWNYQLPEAYTPAIQAKGGVRYNFSGSYGPRLREEVARYAEVAGSIAAQYDFDIIHAHDWLTFEAGLAARRRRGKPLVVHVHATEYDRAGENIDADIYALERRGMEQADHVIAVSRFTKDIIHARYGIPAEKVSVVHNGILPNERQPAGAVADALPLVSDRIVTFLGRITHQKGPQYFVEAAIKVLKKFPDAHFVMAGAGDLLPAMIERVAGLRLSSKFHFTGFLNAEQVDRLWSVSKVYVMPSVSEPFGIAPLEAIQAGVPVILSNQSGVAEVMPHAIRVDFWNTDALADAICNVLKYKSLSGALKKNGRRQIAQITWDHTAKIITRLYHELVNPL